MAERARGRVEQLAVAFGQQRAQRRQEPGVAGIAQRAEQRRARAAARAPVAARDHRRQVAHELVGEIARADEQLHALVVRERHDRLLAVIALPERAQPRLARGGELRPRLPGSARPAPVGAGELREHGEGLVGRGERARVVERFGRRARLVSAQPAVGEHFADAERGRATLPQVARAQHRDQRARIGDPAEVDTGLGTAARQLHQERRAAVGGDAAAVVARDRRVVRAGERDPLDGARADARHQAARERGLVGLRGQLERIGQLGEVLGAKPLAQRAKQEIGA